MASYYTHYRCAVRAANALPRDLAAITENRREVYLAGCHGPDLLFYVFGSFRGYAKEVHECAVFEQFRALVELCRSSGSDDLVAYTLGYLSHYAVDSNFHPFQIHDAATYMPKFFPSELRSSFHMMQEAAIDRILFMRDNGSDAKFRAKDWLPYNDASRTAFATAMTEIAKLFGTTIPFGKLFGTQKRMALYQSMYDTQASSAVMKGVGALIGKPNYIYGFAVPPLDRGIDYLNTERRPYPSIGDEENSPPLDLSVDAILENAHVCFLCLAEKFKAELDGNTTFSPTDFAVSFGGRRTRQARTWSGGK